VSGIGEIVIAVGCYICGYLLVVPVVEHYALLLYVSVCSVEFYFYEVRSKITKKQVIES